MFLVQKELKNAYIGIPNPTGISLDKTQISLTTVGQTEQLTATIEPTLSDHSVTWSSDDTTVATVDQTGLVTCVSPGTCTITATTVNNLTASCNVIPNPPYFFYGDWTNSQWSVWWGSQGTITKTANSIAFSIGADYSTNYLSQYPIDGTKDFLLEFNANIPSTSVSTHAAGLQSPNISILFQTAWQSSYRNKMRCNAGGQYVADGGANPGTADYFIKKEGNVLTMGWNNTTVYTDNNYSFESEYHLCEQVYNDTLTINTASLVYLS